jgi:hypothetical protein
MLINRPVARLGSATACRVIGCPSATPESEDIAVQNARLAIAVAMGLPLACAASPALAQAQDSPQPNQSARYSFNRVDDGFLRLDNHSGQIAFCSPHSASWACQAVPEDRAALEKEIARLQDEVASMKTEIAALRAPPPAPKNDDTKIKLPTSEDIERARVIIEDAWRRLVEMLANFQQDMMRKG